MPEISANVSAFANLLPGGDKHCSVAECFTPLKLKTLSSRRLTPGLWHSSCNKEVREEAPLSEAWTRGSRKNDPQRPISRGRIQPTISERVARKLQQYIARSDDERLRFDTQPSAREKQNESGEQGPTATKLCLRRRIDLSACGGVVLCKWRCKSVNPCVRNAYEAALHRGHLSSGERIILHALAFDGIPKEKIETAASQHI
jgi:hypothetical protein